MKTYKISNINWCVDNQEDLDALPVEAVVIAEDEGGIMDALSDEYGFLVNGCSIDHKKHEHRTNTYNFRSLIEPEDVKNAEKVLYSKGLSYDDAQDLLQEICHVLLDLEIYDEESDEYSTI